MGFDASELPDDNALARIRELSSRRSACLLGERLVRAGLQAPERVAQTLRTLEEARAYCSGHTDALFKLPWSSSGRGQIRVNGKADYRAREQALSGALRRYGFMTAEPFHRDKAVDLAHLFEARDGHVSYSGLSVFKTEANGDYAGNVLASEGRLRAMLELRFQGIGQQLDMLAEAQRQALEELSGQDYEGPMGVDMMILSDGSIVPSVELNLRMTMGHLARRFHDRYCEEGSAGTFRLEGHACGREYPGRYADGVLKEGCLRLNPPEYQTAFMAEIKE